MLFSQFLWSKDHEYYKNLTKETIFVYILGFIFDGISREKTVYTINIWFKFVFGLFFEQDHLLNLIILEFMQKDDLNPYVFQNRKWYSSKSDQWFFFLTLTVEEPFHRKDFTRKKIWGYVLISKKTEASYAEFNKRAEAATLQ